MIVSEILIGGVGLGVGSGLTTPGLAPVGIVCATSISFLSSISTLFTNKYFSKLKLSYTKLRDWFNVITLLYEKTLKQSMIDRKIDQKESEELRKIYNHYLDKRSEIRKNTQFGVEDIFGDIINKDTISPEQITKLKSFFSQKDVTININIKFNFFKPRKKNNINYQTQPTAPPEYSDFY